MADESRMSPPRRAQELSRPSVDSIRGLSPPEHQPADSYRHGVTDFEPELRLHIEVVRGGLGDGRQIESAETLWISQDIDLNDLTAGNREAEHGKQAAVGT